MYKRFETRRAEVKISSAQAQLSQIAFGSRTKRGVPNTGNAARSSPTADTLNSRNLPRSRPRILHRSAARSDPRRITCPFDRRPLGDNRFAGPAAWGLAKCGCSGGGRSGSLPARRNAARRRSAPPPLGQAQHGHLLDSKLKSESRSLEGRICRDAGCSPAAAGRRRAKQGHPASGVAAGA